MKLPLRRPAALLAASVATLAVALPSTALAKPHAKEYALDQFAVPADIATGPDGALYAPDGSLGRLWRITPKGKVSYTEVGSGPAGVAAGNDGALWVTDRSLDQIHRVTTSGQITSYPLPTTGAFRTDIVAGPDGALWFTEASGNRVGRITTTGIVTEFPLDTPDALPGPITGGRDGAIYFAERNTNVLVRMTTAGEITQRTQLPEGSDPLGLVPTRHGLAIAEGFAFRVDFVRPDGTLRRPVDTKRNPSAITVGPDGDLWYASDSFAAVGRIDHDR